MSRYIKVPGTNRPAHSADIAEMVFGNRKAKVPREGYGPVTVQGITIWAQDLDYARRETPTQRFRLRFMAECPVCGREVAVGRLAQHAKIHSKEV